MAMRALILYGGELCGIVDVSGLRAVFLCLLDLCVRWVARWACRGGVIMAKCAANKRSTMVLLGDMENPLDEGFEWLGGNFWELTG